MDRTPTGQLRRSEPNIQNLKPPLTEEQRAMVDAMRSALLKNLGRGCNPEPMSSEEEAFHRRNGTIV